MKILLDVFLVHFSFQITPQMKVEWCEIGWRVVWYIWGSQTCRSMTLACKVQTSKLTAYFTKPSLVEQPFMAFLKWISLVSSISNLYKLYSNKKKVTPITSNDSLNEISTRSPSFVRNLFWSLLQSIKNNSSSNCYSRSIGPPNISEWLDITYVIVKIEENENSQKE